MSWPRWTCASKIGVSFGSSLRTCSSQKSISCSARWSASSTLGMYPRRLLEDRGHQPLYEDRLGDGALVLRDPVDDDLRDGPDVHRVGERGELRSLDRGR